MYGIVVIGNDWGLIGLVLAELSTERKREAFVGLRFSEILRESGVDVDW